MRGADSVVSVGAVRFGCGGAEDSDSASSKPGLRAGDDSSLAMLACFHSHGNLAMKTCSQ